jgi:hypothetical protein
MCPRTRRHRNREWLSVSSIVNLTVFNNSARLFTVFFLFVILFIFFRAC